LEKENKGKAELRLPLTYLHRMEVVLMIENYLITIIEILLTALVAVTILAFALIIVLTIVLSKQQ